MRTGHGFPSMDISVKPPYIKPREFTIPKNNKNILLASGVSRNKLVLFETAYLACTETDASNLMRQPGYDGTELILTDPDSNGEEKDCQTADQILQDQSKISSPGESVSHSQKLKFLSFSSDSLRVEVDNPSNDPRAKWLYYADTWHPFWNAQVNEKDVTVFQANLAYKAIRLGPGSNSIEFRFGTSTYNIAALTISLNWLFLLGMAVAYSGSLFFKKRKAKNLILNRESRPR